MRKVFALIAAFALCSLLSAQVPMTGAGKGAPGGGVTPFGLSFIGNTDQGTPSGGTCDVGTVSIGVADSTRQLILAVGARFTTAATISGVKVAGVSATLIPSGDGASASNLDASLWLISVPAGTTADITATYSTTILRCSVSVYRMVGSTAGVTAANATTGTGTTSLSSTGLSIAAGGGAVGVAVSSSSAVSGTATNLTQDSGHLIASSTTLYQSGSNTTGSGATTFTFSFNTGQSVAAAAWATVHP